MPNCYSNYDGFRNYMRQRSCYRGCPNRNCSSCSYRPCSNGLRSLDCYPRPISPIAPIIPAPICPPPVEPIGPIFPPPCPLRPIPPIAPPVYPPIAPINPIPPVCPPGPIGPIGPRGPRGPYLSSYIEATANAQTVNSRGNIVFNTAAEDLDVAGNAISVDATGSVFTIRQAGLYHVEWSVNLNSATQPVLICLLENGETSSPLSNIATDGNYSSGALINVKSTDLPFTISLHNFGQALSITEPNNVNGSAASIRILKFADGPSL